MLTLNLLIIEDKGIAMVKRIRESINGNPTIKTVIVILITGVFSWIILSVRDLPTNYVHKQEFKEARIEIKVNRARDIETLEKIMGKGFSNIERNMIRQEAKIDKLTDHVISGGR